MPARFPVRLRSFKTEHAAAFVVALAPLLYFLPAASGRLVLCPDDGIIFNLPLRVGIAQIIRDGALPLWNPYIFGGMPMLGAAQGGVLFPLNWFFHALPPQLAMNLGVLLTYALAGLGAYLYARRSDVNIKGALVTALVWQWSGFLVAQVGHTNIIQTAALLPWLLWAIDGYARDGRRWRGVLIAVLVALQTFAGHQQTLAYALLLAGAYAVFMATRGAETDGFERRRARRAYLWSLCFVVAGLATASVQLLPTFELMLNSVRSNASYEFFSSFSMPPVFLLTFVAPYVVGGGDGSLFRAPYVGPAFYAEYIGYVGVCALMLALVAPYLRRDGRTKFWSVVALVALALALGRFWPFDLYHLIYYVPVLNLFRVPARHLMEVDFALAVLAGRAVSALSALERRRRATLVVVACGACVFVLTCLAVTLGRPEDFRLARTAPVTLLRAPELFLPVVVAALSAWAVWRLARGRKFAGASLLCVIVLDVCLWGQSSGWRQSSPAREHALWRTPPAVEFLRRREPQARTGDFRILTTPAPFAADAPSGVKLSRTTAPTKLILDVQPDTYIMHRIENAAGYDGFGLARYSRLAGEMKLWGELGEPDESIRESRAFDLLNVRYLVSPAPQATATNAIELPRATAKLGGYAFAPQELGVPPLEGASARLSFNTPPLVTTRVALVSNLSWSSEVADGATVGRVRLRTDTGRELTFALRAGIETAEWAHEREAARGRIRHKRPAAATSAKMEGEEGDFESHTYVASFELPFKVSLVGVEIEVVQLESAPKLGLNVQRVSLIDETGEGAAVPLLPEWLAKAAAADGAGAGTTPESVRHWQRAGQAGDVVVYENLRALPRAWLATETLSLSDEASLEAIRTGKLADGREWNPRRTALVDGRVPLDSGTAETETRVEILSYEPNRIALNTSCPTASVLVLSENHYPGWRAYLDNHGVETMRVNYNLRGVVVPAGVHEVRFVYRPKSALLGLFISLFACSLLVVWWRGWADERMRRAWAKTGRAGFKSKPAPVVD
jgi:hypothetical protein